MEAIRRARSFGGDATVLADYALTTTNRKRVHDFLLVRNSNLGPILHRFGDIAGFVRSRVTPPLFRPNFGGVPVAPDGSF